MASNDILRRYLDAGLAFTAMTRARAEAIVEDLVKQGEVQTEQAQNAVRDLMDRSRQNTETFFEQVRSEVRDQVSNLGLATQADIARIERSISSLRSSTSTRTATTAKRATAKRATAKRSTAKRATAKRTAKKAAAKRTTAKKATTKRAAARKAPARKTGGRSSTAKKATRSTGSTKKTAAKKA